jgi:DNA helicase-2/ATP-dependent DNA helicase PcrA
MEERLFPHIRALDDLDGMEEERRLCYVGMTRARERLYLLNARRRYLFGQEQSNQPSRFLKDIPKELLDDGGSPPPFQGEGRGGDGYRQANPYPRHTTPHPTPLPEGEREFHNLATVSQSFTNDIEIVPEPPEEHEGIYIGMKVRHAKFGVGTIRKIEGIGEGQKVIVWFNSTGPKKLMLRFAGLERA